MAASGSVQALIQESWTINYEDANTAGLDATLFNSVSNEVDEYKYTAESLVLFHDLDSNGVISGGDTFDVFSLYGIDQLNFGGINNLDDDYGQNTFDISGSIQSSGFQVDPLNYVVSSSDITFYADSPAEVGTFALAPGTGTQFDFTDTSSFEDGLLVQTGTGSGAGANAALIPDGAIDIAFELTDVLSTYGDEDEFGQFELGLFSDLENIVFGTDSNNNACVGLTVCSSTVGSLAAYFSLVLADYDLLFHVRSDGSAVKARVPEPMTLVLMALGLILVGRFSLIGKVEEELS